MPAPPASTPSTQRATWAVVVIGLFIGALMVSRCQVEGDQVNLLAGGWMLTQGTWVVHGNPASGGGFSPGGATSVVVGLPLFLWRDHRAPVVLTLLCHLFAWLLLDQVVRRCLGDRGRLPFALLYWLNPWRLYYSGFLWNPNFLFLVGAIHTWASFAQRDRASFLASLALVLALGVGFQLHPSVFLLGLASLFLWWRGHTRLHWPAVALGTLLAAASLVPWYLETLTHPTNAPISDSYLGRGLVRVYPVLRGGLYWLRYASLWLADRTIIFDFRESLGPRSDALLVPFLWLLTKVLGPLTVAVPILANRWFWRRYHRRPPDATPRLWLHHYVAWIFAAAVVTCCLSPTSIMLWQLLLVQHVAVLPVVLWLILLQRSTLRRQTILGLRVYFLLAVFLSVSMAFGSKMYRRGGRDVIESVWPADHRMLHELNLHDTCTVRLDPSATAWPEAFGQQSSPGR